MERNDEFLRLARSAFSASDTYFNASIRGQMEKDIRQFQSVHPAGSKYYADHYKGRSKIFRPKTRTAIRAAEAEAAAAFFSTDDVVSVKATDDNDEMQLASAEINKELLQYRLTKTIPWYLVCLGAFQEAQAVGVVASLQHWQYDEEAGIDRPWIDLIPPENIRIDPAASWLDPVNTSPYIILQIPMYVQDVRARMGAIDPKTGEPRWKTVADTDLLAATRTGDSIRLQRENGQTDSKDQATEVTDFMLVWVHLNFIRHKGQEWVYYTLGDQKMLSDPKPLKEVYFHGKRPIVFGRGLIEAHKVYSASKSQITSQIQTEINEIANQRIDNVKFAMNKRYFVSRGRQVDVRSLVRNSPSSVTLMNDVNADVRIVETNDVTSSSYAEQDRLNLDFDDIAGAFSGASVQSNRRLNETVGGMNLLSQGANALTQYDLRTFTETWVEPVLRQIMLLEQHYESDEIVLALAGNRARLYQRFGIDAVTDTLLAQELTLSVNVGIGSTNTANQVERFIFSLRSIREILGEQAIGSLKQDEVIKEIFGKNGYKDGSRFFMRQGENPEVDALMDQVNQLQQALNAKHPPELLEAQVAEINERIKTLRAKALKDGVEAIYSAMQTGAVIAQNPMIAPVGDKVMEASGYQPANPSGVDPNIPVPTTLAGGGINAQMPQVNQNTSPTQPPVPASPMQGIETQETGMAQ